jgi:hypothetical protein
MTTLRLTTKAAGVLANVTSVTLANAATGATWGVRRTDTGVVVVAAGTAVPNISIGLYEYTFTDLPGVPYEYRMAVVYGGETFVSGGDWTANVTPATAVLELTDFDEVLVANVAHELEMWGEDVVVHPVGGVDRYCIAIVTRDPPVVVADRPREEYFPVLVSLPNDAITGISGAEWNARFEITIPRYRGSATVRVRPVKPLHQDAALIMWGCR